MLVQDPAKRHRETAIILGVATVAMVEVLILVTIGIWNFGYHTDLILLPVFILQIIAFHAILGSLIYSTVEHIRFSRKGRSPAGFLVRGIPKGLKPFELPRGRGLFVGKLTTEGYVIAHFEPGGPTYPSRWLNLLGFGERAVWHRILKTKFGAETELKGRWLTVDELQPLLKDMTIRRPLPEPYLPGVGPVLGIGLMIIIHALGLFLLA